MPAGFTRNILASSRDIVRMESSNGNAEVVTPIGPLQHMQSKVRERIREQKDKSMANNKAVCV